MFRLKDFNRDSRDFVRDYTDTYMHFKVADNPTPFIGYIRSIEFDGPASRWTITKFIDGNKAMSLYSGDDITITPWYPEAGAYNFGPYVFVLSYAPYRQYKRAFCRDIIDLDCPASVQRLGYQIEGHPTPERADVIKELYSPTRVPVNEGIHKILNGEIIAFALFDQFYVISHPQKKENHMLVMCGEDIVGHLRVDGAVVLKKGIDMLLDVFSDNKITAVMR